MSSDSSENEEHENEIITSRYKYEGSDSSISSPIQAPSRIVPTDQSGNFRQDYHDETVINDSPSRLNKRSSLKLRFNPNDKGTKKQKRCDYDSDERSYEGLGLEYKRRYLHDLAGRDKFLSNKLQMVDFDRQATKKWGDRLLFETLQESEIDTLVALATSYDINVVEKKTLGKMSKISDEAVFHESQDHNPLLSATYDSPLPPSHIDYIKSRALNQIKNADRRKSHKKSYELNTGSSNFKDELVVAMSMYLEECLTASMLPLAGLHVLRCQALEAMSSGEFDIDGISDPRFISNKDGMEQKARRSNICNGKNSLYGLQRTVFHPITGEEVQLDMSRQIRWKDEDVFLEWTLPPEEAVLKLKEHGFLCNNFPYQFIPDTTRSWTPEHLNVENCSNHQEVGNHNFSVSSNVDRDSHISKWAKSYKLDQNIATNNREIFDIFLPQKISSKNR